MLCAAWKGDEVAPLSPNDREHVEDDGGFDFVVSVCGCTIHLLFFLMKYEV